MNKMVNIESIRIWVCYKLYKGNEIMEIHNCGIHYKSSWHSFKPQWWLLIVLLINKWCRPMHMFVQSFVNYITTVLIQNQKQSYSNKLIFILWNTVPCGVRHTLQWWNSYIYIYICIYIYVYIHIYIYIPDKSAIWNLLTAVMEGYTICHDYQLRC